MKQVVECVVTIDSKYLIGFKTLGEVARAFDKMLEETLTTNPNIRLDTKPVVHIGEMTFQKI